LPEQILGRVAFELAPLDESVKLARLETKELIGGKP
jgi:hypothetical protein